MELGLELESLYISLVSTLLRNVWATRSQELANSDVNLQCGFWSIREVCFWLVVSHSKTISFLMMLHFVCLFFNVFLSSFCVFGLTFHEEKLLKVHTPFLVCGSNSLKWKVIQDIDCITSIDYVLKMTIPKCYQIEVLWMKPYSYHAIVPKSVASKRFLTSFKYTWFWNNNGDRPKSAF